jgi:23S rRNA (uridine2552-2'-O)-methyltransferase
MVYRPNDYYARKARTEKYTARSVYKLIEIDQKHHILRKGSTVLDLGASPGSWSQFASQQIGQKGKILGIDLKRMEISLPNAVFLKKDIYETDFAIIMKEHGFTKPFDIVISDMAPDTTSHRFTDQMRSLDLCETAFGVAYNHLRNGGHFVCKIFDSGEVQNFRKDLMNYFSKVNTVRPKSVRSESKEVFIVAKYFKGKANSGDNVTENTNEIDDEN